MDLKGNCLCGAVSFELSGVIPPIYQCHCSLCRRVSGSSSNSALIIEIDRFKWLSGENSISRYISSSGFKSEFCQCCGSPVPNLSASKDKYWVPAGLMSDHIETTIKAHVYVNSRASWDQAFIDDGVEKFATMPSQGCGLKLPE
ncbi:GFA family protein [Vibrio profundi]|uniref:GFA family protein n=1 Tax=Vibrio profundi TaxID=1774960 RepID=UPI003736BBE0